MKTKGIILGGGQSKRMGQDKAALIHKGQTLLQHTMNLLTTLEIHDIIVLGRPSDPHGIADAAPHQGPATNLQLWFKEQSTPFRAVVLPVDMPFLTTESLKHLMSYDTGAYFDDLYLPFVATIGDSPHTTANRMKDLLSQLSLTCVQPPKNWRKQLTNINEIADLKVLDSQN